jgi:hypothetical protein
MTSYESLLKEINPDNIYQHILNLHYERSPVFSQSNLYRARDYIVNCFEQYGLQVNNHEFQLSGSSDIYTNVTAQLNSEVSPKILITSHYDHLLGTPGADDNLSAVAIMLELARIVGKHKVDLPIQFISFDLEEQNPVAMKKLFDKGVHLDLYTDQRLPTNLHFHNMLKMYNQMRIKKMSEGIPLIEIPMLIYQELKPDLTSLEDEFFYFRANLLSESLTPFAGLHGSTTYVEELTNKDHRVEAVLNLETCGYTSNKPHSQHFPPGVNPDFFDQHLIEDTTVGNYLIVVSDDQSSNLGKEFFASCQHSEIQLPVILLAVPMDFSQILQSMPDLLRSDHAPFWSATIPALCLTDSANFRNPFYHTPGDIITTLDFNFIHKVAQATLWTALSHFF